MGGCGPGEGRHPRQEESAAPETSARVRGGCGRKPGYCRQRVRRNEDTTNTKSRAGRRDIGTSPFREPLVPSTITTPGRTCLPAKVRDGRLHDARHTVATVLLIRGVPERVVMQVMGWSFNATVDRYQHVTTGVLADVAKRVGGLIWEVAREGIEGDPQPPGSTR